VKSQINEVTILVIVGVFAFAKAVIPFAFLITLQGDKIHLQHTTFL